MATTTNSTTTDAVTGMHPDPSPYAYHLSHQAFSFDNVMRATVDKRNCVAYCEVRGMLASSMLCSNCDGSMNLCEPASGAKGWRWRCSRKGCQKERRLRAGSFFSKSKLSLCQCVRLMYF